MSRNAANRPRHAVSLAVLVLLAALTVAPAASAQTSGDVTVSATVGTSLAPLTLTICDGNVEFGTNLDANGTASNSNTTANNIAALPGSPAINQGAFYKWTPCDTGLFLISVNATTTWTGSVCATENPTGVGRSSLSIADQDLRFSFTNYTTYAAVIDANAGAASFPVCNPTIPKFDWTTYGGAGGAGGGVGITNRAYRYYLQVDRDETTGTFASTTTWSVTG